MNEVIKGDCLKVLRRNDMPLYIGGCHRCGFSCDPILNYTFCPHCGRKLKLSKNIKEEEEEEEVGKKKMKEEKK